MGALRTLLLKARYQGWSGYCPICEAETYFVAHGDWYRDQLECSGCLSIPRQRALMRVISDLYPDWRSLKIHESSPGAGGASAKLKAECSGYVASWFDHGAAHQDLTRQTFPDASFDLAITQDVFEHLSDPGAAILEIARTLKPGGAHVMTVPIVNKDMPTVSRAGLEAQYHDSPEGRSLVTFDWGYDIAAFLDEHSGLATRIITPEDRHQGLLGEYLDVVVSVRHGAMCAAKVPAP